MASGNAGVQPRPLFELDFEGNDGVNDSERILGLLCRRSFLRLWVQSNVFSDEGLRNGKGNSVELCDALLVFGNDVVIFSDKQTHFQTETDLKVAWGRWYRRSIQESVRQLHGAMHWLERFPKRAFLDARCTKPLPAPVPSGASVRFHLVAVTRGSRDAACAQADGKGRGSLAINSAITGANHLQVPFVVGRPEPRKRFVHVFDEVSIHLVLTELDTAVDFIDYLRKREALLGRPDATVVANGEEDLLATYLTTMSEDDSEHAFIKGPVGAPLPHLMYVLPGGYDELEQAAPYLRKKDADAVSYVWDELIGRFLKYGSHGIAPPNLPEHSLEELERGVRTLASESRFRRRHLGASLVAIANKVGPGQSLTRLVNSGVEGETVYVLSIQSKRTGESLSEYRLFRQQKLFAQVRTAKLLAPQGNTFVGIALDSPHKDYDGFSEDLIVFHQEHWSDEELAELGRMQVDLDLWAGHRLQQSRYRQDEFPAADQRNPFVPIPNAATPTQQPDPALGQSLSGPRAIKPSRAILKARRKMRQACRRIRKSHKK